MEKENKVLIITGGRAEEEFLSLLLERERFHVVIAADSGLSVADRLKLKLDDIVGDFDSVPEEILDRYGGKEIPTHRFPREKDKTDTHIALELALMQKPTSITIVGGTGSRLDHVLANIHLLLLPMQLGIPAAMVDANNKIYLKNKSFTIERAGQFGDYVSLMPFTERVKGLTLKGFKYPLDHIILEAGSSLGISNEISGELGEVEFLEGILLVMETRD
ncbi:MAG TPA: thiamine diphosphokinase [Clostridiales bacterium]|nr:thiamine diphosphokinase [Clostridiales bacterium]